MAKRKHDDSLEQLKTRIDELTDALQRERADAVNQRRHHEDQMTGVRVVAKASVIAELLPVIDNFERALKHVPKELESNDYVKGVRGVVRQFEKTLENMGVTRIETVGHQFDPKYHEAVSLEGDEGKQEIVSEELQAGYRLNDHVIRHAIVKVKLQG